MTQNSGQLGESRLVLSCLVQQMAVPAFVLDVNRQVILWNEACERLTGVSAAQVMGTRNHWQAFYSTQRPCLADLVAQDETTSLVELYPTYALTRRGAQAENWCAVPKHSSLLHLGINVERILDEQGRLVAVMETLSDITAPPQGRRDLRVDTFKDIALRFIPCWLAAFPAVAVGLALLERHGSDRVRNLAVTSLGLAAASAIASVAAITLLRDRSQPRK